MLSIILVFPFFSYLFAQLYVNAQLVLNAEILDIF